MLDAEKEILGFPSWGSDEFWIALELCDNIEGGHLRWERAHKSVSYSVEGPRVKGEVVADFKPEAGQRAEKRGSTGKFVPRLLQSTLLRMEPRLWHAECL